MMNKYAKEQLSKVKVAELPPYDDNTSMMFIPKQSSGSGLGVRRDGCYLIQVAPYILNPPEGFTLHDNWNNGVAPKHEFMKAEVCQLMGKMIKVSTLGFDYANNKDIDDIWSGWLPAKAVRVIKEL
jgi:hypothetical protein